MNINYPDSPDYTNLANLWLQAATEVDQKIETKQNLLNRTVELINRIENVDRSIPHEEVSHICDRVLGEFNRLSPENQDSIAQFAATLGDTSYEYLHKLFQTIGDTQDLPNYFDPSAPPRNLPPAPPRKLLDSVIDRSIALFKSFTKMKPPPAEGITNLGIKVKESIAQSKKSSMNLLDLFKIEEGLQKQILSNLDRPSKIAFKYTSKQYLKSELKKDIVQLLNSSNFVRYEMRDIYKQAGIDSIEELIGFLGPENCKKVKHLVTDYISKSGVSKDSLYNIQQAFPNLIDLTICELHVDVLEGQKDFELLRVLFFFNGESKQLDASSFTHISNLRIYNFPELTTLNNAQKFTSLSELRIDQCPKIDMNFLKNIPSLKKVFISQTTDFSISGLANNPHVSNLTLFRPNCKNFDFLLEMPALKRFRCLEFELPDEIKQKLLQKGVNISF